MNALELRNERRRRFLQHDGDIRCGFDILKETICDEKSPCCDLVRLYAKLGLHCYNFLQGKNYQLRCVKKYNYQTICTVSFFITMDAMDPATSLLHTVQTKVADSPYSQLYVSFNVARPRAENKILPNNIQFSFNEGKLEWPKENPFKNRKRYYMVKNSELEDNKWIRLYSELLVTTTNKRTNFSNLKIVKVAIATSQDQKNEGLNAKNVVSFINYRDKIQGSGW